MDTLSKKYIWLFFAVLITVMVAAFIINISYSPERKPQSSSDLNSVQASYVTVQDSKGNIILQTGIPVYENDEFINEDNVHYIIISIKGNTALARVKNNNAASLQVDNKGLNAAVISYPRVLPAQAGNGDHHVVIYSTHSDESYIPSSGTASKPGEGDVFSVGAELSDALNNAGISTHHSYNKHDPHDINAYHRSRRTVTQLLKQQPDAVFDIHRDSAPVSAYSTSINGVDTARVMIVIGRSNPKMGTNLDYAKSIKDASDDLHPGLMRGIYLGRGDYNQDLYPTALIFEVGTDNNSLTAAQRAVHCLADAIIAVTYR